MSLSLDARIAPNWTSAAGALEGILAFLGAPLPRHAVMGLTVHAWHLCLDSRDGILALPSGPTNLDWDLAVRSYARTGFRWERFGATAANAPDLDTARETAIAWALPHLDAGRPLIGWDFHLHEHAVVFGYDATRRGFLVDDILSQEAGAFVAWEDWPSPLGAIELLAPVAASEADAIETVGEALAGALAGFRGEGGDTEGPPRGTDALDAWAEALDGEAEVDRAGNAYTLAVLQAARLDGAAFLGDLAAGIPDLSPPLLTAQRALRDEGAALAPLLTLFPFPAGGHGNINNPGLRRAAAMALRRAASHERAAAAAVTTALEVLG